MNQELYFVAIVFEGSIGSQINSIKQQMFSSYQSKAALNSPPHLTLHMPFKRKAKDETAIANCVDQACENIHPFEIKFNGFNCFEPRVIYLDVHGSDKLRELHSKVQAALTKGLKVTNSLYKGLPFKPHVTVAFRDLRKQNSKQLGTTLRINHSSTKLCVVKCAF